MTKKDKKDTPRQTGGNTNLQSVPLIKSNKFIIVVNNWSEEEYQKLQGQKDNTFYIIGKEKGSQNGTPHLQCFFEYSKRKTNHQLMRQFPRAHIEKARGSKEDNLIYCSKDNDFITNIPVPRQRYIPELWLDWQKNLVKTLEQPPDNRTIHWIWSCCGSQGKTSFIHNILSKRKDIILINKGKYSDMMNQVYNSEIQPWIVFVDIPRCMKTISYAALESIKDGLITNSKYETGFKQIPETHIVVFCNFEPEIDIFSDDRLKTQKVCNCKEINISLDDPLEN